MPLAPHDPWLLKLLAVAKTRPAMWVPGPETVRNLETYLIGYRQAREDLGMPEFGAGEEDLLEDFTQWLAKRLRSEKQLCWAGFIDEVDPGPKNVQSFFRLFVEFLRERGISLPEPEDAAWPPQRATFPPISKSVASSAAVSPRRRIRKSSAGRS